jgi:TusA-related sulfurtransferase
MEKYGESDRVEDLRTLNCGEPYIYIKGAIRLAARELKPGQTLTLIVPKEKWVLQDETFNTILETNGFEILESTHDLNVVHKLRKK